MSNHSRTGANTYPGQPGQGEVLNSHLTGTNILATDIHELHHWLAAKKFTKGRETKHGWTLQTYKLEYDSERQRNKVFIKCQRGRDAALATQALLSTSWAEGTPREYEVNIYDPTTMLYKECTLTEDQVVSRRVSQLIGHDEYARGLGEAAYDQATFDQTKATVHELVTDVRAMPPLGPFILRLLQAVGTQGLGMSPYV